MITPIIVYSVIVIIFFMFMLCLMDDRKSWMYSITIAKHEGYSKFINSWWHSLVLPKKYIVCSVTTTNAFYSNTLNAKIEQVCRSIINREKYHELKILDDDEIKLISGLYTISIRFRKYWLTVNGDDDVILPPYIIKLIENTVNSYDVMSAKENVFDR